jgi:hypothetical protein
MQKVDLRNGMPYYEGDSREPRAVHAMNKNHLLNALLKATRNRARLIENGAAYGKEDEADSLAQVERVLEEEVLKRLV